MGGLCRCGCGKPTEIAKRDYARYGVRKGEPLNYYRGHRDPEKSLAKARRAMARFRENHPDYQRRFHDSSKRHRDKLRVDTLEAYSSTPPCCACCSDPHLEFLTLDHVNGGGNAAREAEGHRGGSQQYRMLKRSGYPPGYRVLCWNCNAAFGAYGYCPHQKDD